jgi:serine/threonine protein phosphatase PrpC
MNVHSVSMKGHRPQNEDKHNIIVNLNGKDKSIAPVNYYAVYDGHGGKYVSTFLSKHLPATLIDRRIIYPLKNKTVKDIYNHWDNVLRSHHKKQSSNTGSTCLVVIHYKIDNSEYLNILNTGDSRCVICRNNIGISLTKDHKPHWPEEKSRIKSLGGEPYFDGYDWRIKDLSVSRAFGDLNATPYVTHMPDIFRYKLSNNDKFIVVACDGLWDVLCDHDVVNFILDNCYDPMTNKRINKNKKQNVSQRLGEYAIAKGSTDNITILIAFFD